MWQALVTVCLIQSMSDCLILEDQGWYESEMRCQKRALEMASDVNRYMKSHKPTRYECRKLKGGMLTR